MRQKWILLILALLMLPLSHLRLSYRVAVGETSLEGRYAPETLRRCRAVAGEAAEEILKGPAEEPGIRRRACWGLRSPDGDPAELTEALLLEVDGVVLADQVIVNGPCLGTVKESSDLFERLRCSIRDQMPNAAAVGNISGRLQTRRVFAREGSQTNYDDMVLLITGMAPVIYVDRDGKLV